MVKKILKFLSVFLFIFGSCFLLASCFDFGNKNADSEKIELTEDMISTHGVVPYYNYGEPVTIPAENFEIWVPKHGAADINDFTITFANNINVDDNSTYTVTAKKGLDYVTGSVTKSFQIYPIDRELTNQADFDSLYYSANTNRLIVKCDLTIAQNQTLNLNQIGREILFKEEGTTLTNNGTINFDRCSFLFDGPAKIINNGTMNISSGTTFRIYDSGVILDYGTINNQGTIQCYGTIYTHDHEIPNVTNINQPWPYRGGNMYVRTPISEANIYLQYSTVTYVDGTEEYLPMVMMTGGTDRTVEYVNNTGVGTATVTISVGTYNTSYYGSPIQLTFTITKGTASVSTFEQLETKQASGNFDKYIINSSFNGIPSDKTFTLGENETIEYSVSSFNIAGTFINNGTFLYNPTGNSNWFTINGTLENNGLITATSSLATRKNYISVGGTFKNGNQNNHNATFTCDTFYEELASAVFENYGTMDINQSSSLTCPIFNSENAVLTFKKDTTIKNSITNNGTINFAQNKDVNLSKLSITNSGTINNAGDIVIADEFENFVNSGTINNAGHIWTYYPLGSFTENVTIKKRLSDLSVEIDYDEIDYDATAKRPFFTIKDGETNVRTSGSSFNITYTYTQWNAYQNNTTTNKNKVTYPGTIQATLKFTTEKYEYGGTYSANYTIKRSIYRATTEGGLETALDDRNYIGYSLESNICLTSYLYASTYTIAQDQTFDTNNHCLTIENRISLINGGTMILSSTLSPSLISDCSLVVKAGGSFTNNGALENNGVLYISVPNIFIQNGTIENNGDMYVFDNITTTGNGNVYKRKYLDNLKDNYSLRLAYSTTLYDETDKTPAPVLTGSEGKLSTTYQNNRNPGTATATISVINIFDTVFAGSTSLDFTIERGIKILDFTTEYRDSQNNLFSNENYAIYKLGRDIKIRGYAVADLPEDTTLDLDDYIIDTIGYYSHIGIPSSSHIHANVDNSSVTVFGKSRWEYTTYIADKLTLTSDIGADSSTIQYVYSTEHLDRAYYNWATPYSEVSIDLNGHTIKGTLEVRNAYDNIDFTLNITNTNENEAGVIGSIPVSNYGLLLNQNYKTMTLNLSNITVYGCKNSFNGAPDKQNITASNCSFFSGGQYAIYNGGNLTLTDCTVTAATAMYIDSKGDVIIRHSTINSTGSFAATRSSINIGTGSSIIYYCYNNHADLTIEQNSTIYSMYGSGIEYVYWKQQSGGATHRYIVINSNTHFSVSGQQILDTPITG